MLNVTIWNEFIHEKDEKIAKVYPEGIHSAIKEKLSAIACKFSSKHQQEETRKTIAQKIEERFGFCHITHDAEIARNFFISNHKTAALYYKLWTAKKLNRLPLILLTSFRLLVVMFFIVMAIHQFLTENPKVTMVMLVVSILVLFHSRWLFNQYMKIETQFLDNLKGSHPEAESENSPTETEAQKKPEVSS